MSVPNQTNLLAACHRLTFRHKNFVEMGVQRISIFQLAAFIEGVTDYNNVAPRTFEIASQTNYTVPDRGDRQIGRASCRERVLTDV